VSQAPKKSVLPYFKFGEYLPMVWLSDPPSRGKRFVLDENHRGHWTEQIRGRVSLDLGGGRLSTGWRFVIIA
jgi:hypothetical protein